MISQKDRQPDTLGVAMTEAEAALRQALLDALVNSPCKRHESVEDLTDTAWEYLQAADRAHPVVAAVLREAAGKLAG